MSHANATLTPLTRLRLARLIVEAGWTYAAAAKMFMVNPRNREEVGRSLPNRRRRRDDRPQFSAACESEPDEP